MSKINVEHIILLFKVLGYMSPYPIVEQVTAVK